MNLRRAKNPMPADVRGAIEARGLTATYDARPAYQRNGWRGWIGRAKRHVAFVYDATCVEPPARPPSWWRALEWVAPGNARARDFGWNADLARAMGVARGGGRG